MDRYQLIDELGRGGLAKVYRARDLLRDDLVALKLVEPGRPELVEAFRQEFATLASLFHPRLCQVHDFGRTRLENGELALYYTSEIIDGTPIDVFAADRPWNEVALGFADGLRALRFLHRSGIRHGDFKPDNLLVDAGGRGTLIDLSCAGEELGRSGPAGTVSGTLGFLAPELTNPEGSVDHRADLFAVGRTLQRLLDAVDEHPDLESLIDRLTREQPAERPGDVDEVLAALGFEPDHTTARRAAAPPRQSRSPFVGRAPLLAQLRATLRRLEARAEGIRALWLHGPEGIGRSRALAECTWLAQLELTVVEGEATRPDAVASMFRRALGDATLVDDLRLASTCRDALVDRDEPVLFVLDDAQLLDESQGRLLQTFLHLLQPDDPIGAVITSRLELDNATLVEPGVVKPIALEPLTAAELRQWTAGSSSRLPDGKLGELARVTGGLPGEVSSVLALIRSGAEDLTALAARADDGDDRQPSRSSLARLRALTELPPRSRRALGFCAAFDGTLPRWAPGAFDLEPDALGRLTVAGWLTRAGAGTKAMFRLVRLSDATRLAGAIGLQTMARHHREIAAWHAEHDGPAAATIYHLARAGEQARAANLLEASREQYLAKPGSYRRAAEALLEGSRLPATLLTAAEVLELGGEPRHALELVRDLLEGQQDRLEPHERGRAAARMGSCYLKLGDARAALRHLARARELTTGDSAGAALADLECRALIQAGDYRDAADLARQALPWTSDPADLHEDLGVALSYLGETEEARDQLDAAERLGRGDRGRARVRILSYRAILEYRVGRFGEAAERYRLALELAEAEGLVDQAGSCALNLGTVSHRRGDWGAALAAYEKGLAYAVAVSGGRVKGLRAEVALRLNLAQLYSDLGRFDRALQYLAQTRQLSSAGNLGFFVAACDLLDGEIALFQANHDAAAELLDRAAALFRAQGAAREVADAELLRTDLALRRGDPDRHQDAEQALAAAGEAIDDSDAADLDSRASLLSARLALARGNGPEALALLERARPGAAENEERDLVAEIDSWLAAACTAVGAAHAARRYNDKALQAWDRCAATLPSHLRETIWRHPRRSQLPQAGADEVHDEPPRQEPQKTPREAKLERLLAINARLNSTLKTKDVLEYTMDAAVELTGAERGFLILAPDPKKQGSRLKVAVARNLDRESVGRSSLKFSRSIAEKVLASGEPLFTAEALSDDRFATTHSVQAMRLKSVMSVPIRGPRGILGALYVDNRFERGLFEQADMDILLGFADQVGIALTNARLHDELDARTRELEKERKRIARSLKERTREVDRLAEQVKLTRQALSLKGDFSGIVGRSRPMQALFSTVDRVADSSLTVLIQGESGTGKELVARAVHDNSPRKRHPFVSVNCAALPETLLESELFGHIRGAFTGADRDRTGLLVHAGEGTLFLDEIGELPLGMQSKLLRAIQEREVRPLGTTRSEPVAARVLCATNRRLLQEVEAGRFREDLYYRLAVVVLEVPPLRERLEDLPELVRHLLERLARETNRAEPTLTPAALRKLLGFDYPGNVRQLENLLSQALVFCTGDTIDTEDLQLPAGARRRRRSHREFQAAEAAEIAAALHATRWNVTEVGRMLKIPRTSLYRKLKQYGLTRKK